MCVAYSETTVIHDNTEYRYGLSLSLLQSQQTIFVEITFISSLILIPK